MNASMLFGAIDVVVSGSCLMLLVALGGCGRTATVATLSRHVVDLTYVHAGGVGLVRLAIWYSFSSYWVMSAWSDQ